MQNFSTYSDIRLQNMEIFHLCRKTFLFSTYSDIREYKVENKSHLFTINLKSKTHQIKYLFDLDKNLKEKFNL